jgi:hypothetical protein
VICAGEFERRSHVVGSLDFYDAIHARFVQATRVVNESALILKEDWLTRRLDDDGCGIVSS